MTTPLPRTADDKARMRRRAARRQTMAAVFLTVFSMISPAPDLRPKPNLPVKYQMAKPADPPKFGFDAFAAGNEAHLREKTRYMADRIAMTELARAHQARVAEDLIADPDVTAVQVRINPRHPRKDICDVHARADLFGLGAGIYPKARVPRPPFHPYCWCRLTASLPRL